MNRDSHAVPAQTRPAKAPRYLERRRQTRHLRSQGQGSAKLRHEPVKGVELAGPSRSKPPTDAAKSRNSRTWQSRSRADHQAADRSIEVRPVDQLTAEEHIGPERLVHHALVRDRNLDRKLRTHQMSRSRAEPVDAPAPTISAVKHDAIRLRGGETG